MGAFEFSPSGAVFAAIEGFFVFVLIFFVLLFAEVFCFLQENFVLALYKT